MRSTSATDASEATFGYASTSASMADSSGSPVSWIVRRIWRTRYPAQSSKLVLDFALLQLWFRRSLV